MDLEYCLLVVTALISVVFGKTKVTSIKEEPYLKAEGTKYTGFIPDLMKAVADKKDIDYEFHIVRDGKYGAFENGQWTGMIKEILDNKADMAAAPITISKQRKEAINFSVPFMSFGTTIIMKRPEEGKSKAINNAQELADQTDIGYGFVKEGETHRFFKNSTKNPYKKMWQYMQSHPEMLVTTLEQGVKKVRDSNGKYAFLIESSTADYWVNREPCDLIKVGDTFNSKSYGFGIRKENSQLKKKVDDALKELKESGKVDELKRKYWNSDAQCPNAAGTSAVTLSAWSLSLLAAFILSR